MQRARVDVSHVAVRAGCVAAVRPGDLAGFRVAVDDAEAGGAAKVELGADVACWAVGPLVLGACRPAEDRHVSADLLVAADVLDGCERGGSGCHCVAEVVVDHLVGAVVSARPACAFCHEDLWGSGDGVQGRVLRALELTAAAAAVVLRLEATEGRSACAPNAIEGLHEDRLALINALAHHGGAGDDASRARVEWVVARGGGVALRAIRVASASEPDGLRGHVAGDHRVRTPELVEPPRANIGARAAGQGGKVAECPALRVAEEDKIRAVGDVAARHARGRLVVVVVEARATWEAERAAGVRHLLGAVGPRDRLLGRNGCSAHDDNDEHRTNRVGSTHFCVDDSGEWYEKKETSANRFLLKSSKWKELPRDPSFL